jgi:hypothetical protein
MKVRWDGYYGGRCWCLEAWMEKEDDDVALFSRAELLPRELSRARTAIGLGTAFTIRDCYFGP